MTKTLQLSGIMRTIPLHSDHVPDDPRDPDEPTRADLDREALEDACEAKFHDQISHLESKVEDLTATLKEESARADYLATRLDTAVDFERRKFWCEIYTAAFNIDMDCLAEKHADYALAEFEKRFRKTTQTTPAQGTSSPLPTPA